jgi:hypothetical protein
MSEFFDLRDQANDVAETAKDAMKNHGLVADKTTRRCREQFLKSRSVFCQMTERCSR